jgi:hypothetical protein
VHDESIALASGKRVNSMSERREFRRDRQVADEKMSRRRCLLPVRTVSALLTSLTEVRRADRRCGNYVCALTAGD